jgi:hypothetical protein
MDRLSRLIALLVSLALCWGTSHAEGVLSVTPAGGQQLQWRLAPDQPWAAYGGSGAVASASAGRRNSFAICGVTDWSATGSGSATATVNGASVSYVPNYNCTSPSAPACNGACGPSFQVATASACPANSTQNGSQCICGTGYQPSPDGQTCVSTGATCQVIANAANSLGVLDGSMVATSGGSIGSLQFCSAGCYFSANASTFGTKNGVTTGVFHPPFTVVSSTCPPSVPAATTGPKVCPPGQLPGTVNGVETCAPAGTTTTAEGTVSKDASGSVTGSTSSTTTCTGLSCTRTTTTKDAAGNVTGTVTDSKTRDAFCVENPDATICKQSSFTQSCNAGTAAVACDGDAIQCAIAKEQHKRMCQLFDATGATKTLGDDAIARGDTRANDHPGASGNVVTIGNGTSGVDSTDLLSANASCPADEVLTVSGSQTVTVAWSKLCTPVGYLGNILVALTALAWVFIAFKQG